MIIIVTIKCVKLSRLSLMVRLDETTERGLNRDDKDLNLRDLVRNVFSHSCLLSFVVCCLLTWSFKM